MKTKSKQKPLDNNNKIEEKELLEALFRSFRTGISSKKAVAPRTYLDNRGLDFHQLEIGFNSGQFHHRKDEAFRKPYEKIGVLTKSKAATKTPDMTAYTCFGNYSIVFPLKDKDGRTINLYAIRIKKEPEQTVYLNEEGIYPNYPQPLTTRLFLTNNIIGAASILQSGILENRDAVIALDDGKYQQKHQQAIANLTQLEEIIIIQNHQEKTTIQTTIQELLPQVNVTTITLPENHTLNDMLTSYNPEGMLKWIEEEIAHKTIHEQEEQNKLQVISPTEYFYKGEELTYRITGILPTNTTQLEMQVAINTIKGNTSITTTIDFFNPTQIKQTMYELTEKVKLNYNQAILEIENIAQELKQHRRKNNNASNVSTEQSSKIKQETAQLLLQENLFETLDTLIEATGIIGEKHKRLLLYLLAASYKTNYNLHAVIQSPNSHLGAEMVRNIARLIPEKDTYEIDIIAPKSFRYYVNNVINRKLLIIEDYQTVINAKAITDLFKIQSSNIIRSDVPKKSPNGLLSTIKYDVNGHISSIGAITNAKQLFTKQPKTVVVELENTKEQLEQLIHQDCLRLAGLIQEEKQQQAIERLRCVISNLHSQNVVNPIAPKLMLPSTFPGARTITMQLLNLIALITLFKQRQRQLDEQGRIITELEDVKLGIQLYFKSVTIGQQGLDTATIEFFNSLKKMVKEKGENSIFTTQEIITALNLSKTTVNRHLKTLTACEYIQQEGYINKGFNYQITNWNSSKKIKNYLMEQLQEKSSEPKADGSLG